MVYVAPAHVLHRQFELVVAAHDAVSAHEVVCRLQSCEHVFTAADCSDEEQLAILQYASTLQRITQGAYSCLCDIPMDEPRAATVIQAHARRRDAMRLSQALASDRIASASVVVGKVFSGLRAALILHDKCGVHAKNAHEWQSEPPGVGTLAWHGAIT